MTYHIWIGGSCDYGHKERAGGAAVVIEQMECLDSATTDSATTEKPRKKAQGNKCQGTIVHRDITSGLHTTEFRMMLTLMVRVMHQLPPGSDILFLTNAAYIQNFDKSPTPKSANPDLIRQCIGEKQRHHSVGVKIVPYHKNPLLMETHDMATEAMTKVREEFHRLQTD